ncbi:MAG: polysaccharide pyruvyl transferase family protein [Candidatus Bathyarchaeum tardum]|nr:MAG: polysaccharide pyruvyl transferase family protein [Candidatus Bathyarchaeum tardum]
MDSLEETLIKYRDRRFIVIEPGGNHGDTLIYKGMMKKLLQLQIKHMVLKYDERFKSRLFNILYFVFWKNFLKILIYSTTKLSETCSLKINGLDLWLYENLLVPFKIQAAPTDVILIHGGGNINDLWQGVRLLKSVLKYNPCNIIIVAPQTYWFNKTCFSSLFSKTKEDIFLFCREKFSYKLLSSLKLTKNVHVFLSNDTAFYLTKEDFNIFQEDNYSLICLRTDKESRGIPEIETSKRLLKETSLAQVSKNKLLIKDLSVIGNFNDFIRLIGTSKQVYTDRLHVAILATILGKETFLYPNSYYKNKGVYEYSLSRYPNVTFFPLLPSFDELKNHVELTNRLEND